MIVVKGTKHVYWGIEHDASDDPKQVSQSWLVEDMPPYRRSIRAIRIRVNNRALHLGLCKPDKAPHHELADVTPNDISQWRR